VPAVLIRWSKRGDIFQVVRDLFFHGTEIRALAEVASRLHAANGEVCLLLAVVSSYAWPKPRRPFGARKASTPRSFFWYFARRSKYDALARGT
jgi:hypothetical protein